MAPGETTCYIAARYCALCRNPLPWRKPGDPPDRIEHCEWELDVIGFIDLSGDSLLSPDIYSFHTNLADSSFLSDRPLVLKHRRGNTRAIEVCDSLSCHPSCDPSRPVFFIHACCLKAVRIVQPHFLPLDFYKLSQNLHPILPHHGQSDATPWQLDSFPDFASKTSTDLGILLTRCARLPRELQRHVVQMTPSKTLPFFLMAACQTASFYASHRDSRHGPVCKLQKLSIASRTVRSWIQASFTSVFGTSYLRHIRLSDQPPVHIGTALKLGTDEVKCVMYVVGLHGIRAIRLEFNNGSMTDWLGCPDQGWHSSTISSPVNNLTLLHDDLKILRIESNHGEGKLLAPSIGRGLWDSDPYRLQQYRMCVAQMGHFVGNTAHYSDRHLFQYLPLEIKGLYATGFTVYNDTFGTCRIIVHRKGYHHVAAASDLGTPRFFSLRHGEKVTMLGLVSQGRGASQFGPYLLIKTSLERTCFFGPAIFLRHPSARLACFVSDAQDVAKSTVAGFIVDMAMIKRACFRSMGCSTRFLEEISNPNGAQTTGSPGPHEISMPSSITTPIFLQQNCYGSQTLARMSSVRRLAIQKRKVLNIEGKTRTRYAGLCIYHTDGSIETLGQWDGSRMHDSTVIYDAASDGLLDCLVFCFERGRGWEKALHTCHFVVNIHAQSLQAEDILDKKQDEAYSEPLKDGSPFLWVVSDHYAWMEWWFTEYHDYIAPCRSANRNIRMVNHDEAGYFSPE